MCGIVAVISKKAFGFLAKDIEVFTELLYVDNLRGDDSTGVIGVDKYGDMFIDKSAEDAPDFLFSYTRSAAMKEIQKDGNVLIGHNRKGTVGKISDVTAHPFVVKDQFAMVHNGTLWNHTQLHNTDVDSEALAKHIEGTINKQGYVLDDLANALADVYGAYAVVWYNQVTNRVQFLRNDQRPLWLCEDDNSYYLGSEGGMLHWILTRNGIKYKNLEMIKTDTLYTITPGYTNSLLVETLPEKKAAPVSQSTGGTGSTSQVTDTAGSKPLVDQVSKNKFKKLNRKVTGQKIEFYIDDYVEKYPFTGDNKVDWKIMGITEALGNYAHIVKGDINLTTLGLAKIECVEEEFFTGVISQSTYDPRTKQIELHVKDIKLVPHVPVKKATDDKETYPVTLH